MKTEKIKKWVFPVLLAGLVILAGLNLVRKSQSFSVRVEFSNGRSLIAEVADSPEEHLMAFYSSGTLGRDQAVLIMYEESGRHSVWTKSLRAPVDILWLNPSHEIVKIQENILPCSSEPCPSYESREAVSFLLQTHPGVMREFGVEEGMKVRFGRMDGPQDPGLNS